MKRIIIILFMISSCFGCTSSSAPPPWQNKASAYLDDYKVYFLSGKEDVSEPHFVKARKELAAGNDLDLLSAAYLTKYALHTACLEGFDSADFAKLYRIEPNPAHLAYCHFLKGNFKAVDMQIFPPRYAGVLKAALLNDLPSAGREISAIEDPISRLVACGVWVRYLSPDENILQIAIKTSSVNGWRRPLFAYLEKLQIFYSLKGELSKAEAVRLRLEMLKK